MASRCHFIPPHVHRSIAESAENPEKVRQAATASIACHDRLCAAQKERMEAMATSGESGQASPRVTREVLEHIANSDSADEEVRSNARLDLKKLGRLGEDPANRGNLEELSSMKSRDKKQPYRAVYNANHMATSEDLPGKLVRAEGDKKTKDKDANAAYDNLGYVLKFYKEHMNWNSLDNENADVISSVHFGIEYENAFWDPSKKEMVFGDGGELINNFAECLDVIAHELTHAVMDNISPLDYSNQSGALSEHISDVFGSMVKQMVANEKADAADWLIGEGCLVRGVKGLALRSMKNPGKAYNDPRLGRDPQVGHMSDYEKMKGSEDDGGVHIFSGIPNRAFYRVAMDFGGYSWEKAGKIWWAAMNSGKLPRDCKFKLFADTTVECAKKFGDDASKTVAKAWKEVGVLDGN